MRGDEAAERGAEPAAGERASVAVRERRAACGHEVHAELRDREARLRVLALDASGFREQRRHFMVLAQSIPAAVQRPAQVHGRGARRQQLRSHVASGVEQGDRHRRDLANAEVEAVGSRDADHRRAADREPADCVGNRFGGSQLEQPAFVGEA